MRRIYETHEPIGVSHADLANGILLDLARFDADADPFWALCVSDCSSVPEFGERKRSGAWCEEGQEDDDDEDDE